MTDQETTMTAQDLCAIGHEPATGSFKMSAPNRKHQYMFGFTIFALGLVAGVAVVTHAFH